MDFLWSISTWLIFWACRVTLVVEIMISIWKKKQVVALSNMNLNFRRLINANYTFTMFYIWEENRKARSMQRKDIY